MGRWRDEEDSGDESVMKGRWNVVGTRPWNIHPCQSAAIPTEGKREAGDLFTFGKRQFRRADRMPQVKSCTALIGHRSRVRILCRLLQLGKEFSTSYVNYES